MKKKKVLLTGGSGAVGFETFKELLRRKDRYDIRIFNLDQKRERKIFAPYTGQAEMIWGDLRDTSLVEKAVRDVDYILHIAALIPPTADRQPNLAWDINVGGTTNILKGMENQPTTPKLIYTSSISVYGDRINNPEIRVGDPLRPSDGDEYARTKIEAEKRIRDSGVTWTIFRLCGILYPNLSVQPLMFHMPLDTSLEFCHNSDAGFALVEAIESNALWGKTFNLGGGEQCRTNARAFIKTMMPFYGVNPETIPEYAFATRNFHSGFYKDSDMLEKFLHFQKHTLEDHFNIVKEKVSPFQRFMIHMIPRFLIRAWMLRMSEPYKAIQENNKNLIARFYGSRKIFENLFLREEGSTYA